MKFHIFFWIFLLFLCFWQKLIIFGLEKLCDRKNWADLPVLGKTATKEQEGKSRERILFERFQKASHLG